MKYTNTMCKARMSGAWINKFRKTELFYTPKPLKFSRVYQFPKKLIEFTYIKLNKIV